MSQSYFLKRDKLSWKYKNRSFPYASWSFFTDQEVDLPSMKKYLSRSSDSVSVSFVTDDLRPANYFEVTKGDSKVSVSMNAGQKTFDIYEYDFLDPKDAEQFFHDRTTEENNQKADRQKGLSKIDFYKNNADTHTLTEYNDMITQRMTDDSIRQKLKEYDPEVTAEVFFNTEPSVSG
jgi:hypothetical protein